MSVRIFKSKPFKKFADKSDIADKKLTKAVKEIEQGLIDADLGGGVLKKRIARQGQGKRGGYRVVILFQKENRAFFVHGFSKNDQESLTNDEEKKFKEMAKSLFEMTEKDLTNAINKKIFVEVKKDDKNIQE